MNEIREVAMAYYARATAEEKELAQKFFRSLDADGDGRVSLEEYKRLARSWFSNEQLFKKLDEDGDGTLDFEEVLALYYMQKLAIPRCDSCRDLLAGAYFSCLLCEKNSPKSCDLCCKRYGGGKFQHHHSVANFIDNRSMRVLLTQIIMHADITQLEETAELALEALNGGFKFGGAVLNIAVETGSRIM